MTKLERATNKYVKNKFDMELDYTKPFKDFIIDCYLNYGPSSYGVYIQKKIVRTLQENGIASHSLSQKKNRGDFNVDFKFKYVSKITGSDISPNFYYGIFESSKHFEFKSSYLGKNGGYTIRNIRPYQEIDGGYLLCFIDCENDFNEEFYLVDYVDIKNIFKLSHMNGVSSEHKDNGFVNYGASFYKGSAEHYLLSTHSKLDGNDMYAVTSYFHKLNNDFINMCKSTEVYDEYNNCDDRKRVNVEEYFYYHNNVEFKESFINIKTPEDYSLVVSRVIDKLKQKYDRLVGSYEDPRAKLHQIFVIRGSKNVNEYFPPLFVDYMSEFIMESKLLK